MPHQRVGLLLLLLTSALLLSCDGIRSVTYPPGIHYIDKQEIESTMYNMAVELRQLDALIAAESDSRAVQTRVVAVLDEINRLASSLDQDGQSSNHPAIDARLDEFLAQVTRASLQAQRVPPNYYEAGRLSGSCSACHQLRPID